MTWLKKMRRALGIGVRVFLVAAAVWLGVLLLLSAAIVLRAQPRPAESADAIIVLGAGVQRNGSAGPSLTRRAGEGARLYLEGYAPVVICTGGVPHRRPRSEAEACADVLRARGVPDTAIILERRSRSTEENAIYSRQIFDAHGWGKALVVSDGYHLLRAGWIFQQQGIDALALPTSEQAPQRDITFNISRELVALHWQVFKTILNLPYTYVPAL